jgi:hypothetical protein
MGSHKLRTQLHFIDVNMKAQRYSDEILRTIVVPFIHHHHLMFQHNARPHVTRFCTQFPEAENVPVLPWFSYLPDMSPIGHIWYPMDRRVRQRVTDSTNIKQVRTAIEEEWDYIP